MMTHSPLTSSFHAFTRLIPCLAFAGLASVHSAAAQELPELSPELQALVDSCSHQVTRSAGDANGRVHILSTRFHSNPFKASVTCGINTRLSRAGDANDIEDRTLAVNNQGMIQVVVSDETIPGPLSTITGTHTFYVLPKQPGRTVPTLAIDPESGDFLITAMNGETFRVNSVTARIESYSGGSVREDDIISLGPTGGVTFDSIHSGLLLDCGWRTGNVATARSGGACQVRDSKGKSCSVPNSLLFRYLRVGGATTGPIDEVIPLFDTNDAMNSILGKVPACATLDRDWAKPRAEEAAAATPCEPGQSTAPVTGEAKNLPALMDAISGAATPSPAPSP